jgi:hypothetical protein
MADSLTSWTTIPDALLVHTLRTLPMPDLCAVRQVCRAWRSAMVVEAATVVVLIRQKTIQRFPYLTKLLANFPEAVHDFQQLYQEQLQLLKPPVDLDNLTLHDFVFTIRIREPDTSSVFEWSGTILDPESVQLWSDAEAPGWCAGAEDEGATNEEQSRLLSLRLDLLVSRMTPRGLRTIRLCDNVEVDGLYPSNDEMCFDCELPSKFLWGYNPTTTTLLFRPWIGHRKVGGGNMFDTFRSNDDDVGIASPEAILAYLKALAPWGDVV